MNKKDLLIATSGMKFMEAGMKEFDSFNRMPKLKQLHTIQASLSAVLEDEENIDQEDEGDEDE